MQQSNKRKRIVVIHLHLYTFVKQDIEILKTKYNVVEISVSSIKRPLSFLIMLRYIITSQLIFCWFADHQTLLAVLIARILRKKSIVIIMGYEVANVPEIGYGRILKRYGRYFVYQTIRYADKVVALSNWTKTQAFKNLRLNPDKVDIQILYLGFPISFIDKDLLKLPMVLTVAFIKWGNVKRKGLEMFVKSAAYLPSIPFIVIGYWIDNSIDYLKSIASTNVKFIETPLGGSEVITDYFRKAKVYVQASLHESFGCALAEAMLWECVPVVTRCSAIPEVVGNTGFYTLSNDPKELASKIAQANKSDSGQKARERIIRMYPLEKRKKTLLELVEETMNDKNSLGSGL